MALIYWLLEHPGQVFPTRGCYLAASMWVWVSISVVREIFVGGAQNPERGSRSGLQGNLAEYGYGCVESLTGPQGNPAEYSRLCEVFPRYVHKYAESESDCLMIQEIIVVT